MPLEFESQEAIPETLREDFIQLPSGKWGPKGFVPADIHEAMKADKAKHAEKLKALEAKAAAWGEDDPEKLRASLKDLEKLKREAEAAKHGKTTDEMDELFKARYEQMISDHQVVLKSKDSTLAERETLIRDLQERLNETVIDGQVEASIAALAKDGFRADVPTLHDDAKVWVRRHFVIENGKAVYRDPVTKETKLSKDGGEFTIREFIAATKVTHPHAWRPVGSGGGGNGNESPPSGKTMSRQAFENLPMSSKTEFLRGGGKLVDAAA